MPSDPNPARTLLATAARQILLAALNSPFGITVEIVDPSGGLVMQPASRAKQVLYRFKNEDVDFANIQIRFSPDNPDKELWLIKLQ